MNLQCRLVTSAALIGVLAMSGPSLLGQEVGLRYRWAKGDELRYRLTQESSVAMSGVPGLGEITVTTSMTQVQQLTAADVAADGVATVAVRVEAVRMGFTTPAGTSVYDSAAPATQSGDPIVALLGQVMGALIGESITVVMEPTGAVRSVQGMTRLMEKVQKAMPPDAAGAMNQLGGLETMMTDDAMRGTFGQSFANLPAQPVKPGDTWQNEIKTPNPLGAMTISTTFTLKGVERVDARDVTRIAFTQRIKSAPGGMMGPMTVQMGDGAGEGDMLFDHEKGRVLRTTAHNTLPMTMSMAAPDGSSLTIQGLTKTTLTMELVSR